MGRVRHGLVPAADQLVHRAEVREIDSFPVIGTLVVISHSGVSIAMDSPVVGSRFCEKLHLAALHGHHHQSSPGGTPKTR